MDPQEAQDLARTLHMAGGILGGCVGMLGGLVGVLAPRGKCKRFVVGGMTATAIFGGAALIVGVVLALRGVPFIVYWPVALIGLVLSLVTGPMIPFVLKAYREADVRRLDAAALRHS